MDVGKKDVHIFASRLLFTPSPLPLTPFGFPFGKLLTTLTSLINGLASVNLISTPVLSITLRRVMLVSMPLLLTAIKIPEKACILVRDSSTYESTVRIDPICTLSSFGARRENSARCGIRLGLRFVVGERDESCCRTVTS